MEQSGVRLQQYFSICHMYDIIRSIINIILYCCDTNPIRYQPVSRRCYLHLEACKQTSRRTSPTFDLNNSRKWCPVHTWRLSFSCCRLCYFAALYIYNIQKIDGFYLREVRYVTHLVCWREACRAWCEAVKFKCACCRRSFSGSSLTCLTVEVSSLGSIYSEGLR